jgi:uncharacterized protein (DUF1810 family)
MPDSFDLSRFVTAQEPLMPRVLQELRAGQKRSHWMWFVFPQLAGLGRSPMAQHYAIGSPEEARAYLAHPVLKPRLIACTEAVNAVDGPSVHAIFGSPDDMKFHSSVTLFARAAEPGEAVFRTALERHFDGAEDPRTLALLGFGDS